MTLDSNTSTWFLLTFDILLFLLCLLLLLVVIVGVFFCDFCLVLWIYGSKNSLLALAGLLFVLEFVRELFLKFLVKLLLHLPGHA